MTDNVKIIHYNTLPSTNDTAKELAKEGTPSGTVITADAQTKGKGRNGRSFFSPENQGLYMSVILAPKLPANYGVSITVGAAVAVQKAIKSVLGITVQIKWVNDLLLGGKKVCGILAEGTNLHAASDGTPFFDNIILGVGVNLNQGIVFPEEIKTKAGSLSVSADNMDEIKTKLALEISQNLLCEIHLMEKNFADGKELFSEEFIKYYNENSAIIGKEVCLSNPSAPEGTPKSPQKVTVLGIDARGALAVKDIGGEVIFVNSGEISIVF